MVDSGMKPSRAARLRLVRETLGLSQREFAEELGVAPSALAQWETERRSPPGPILRLLALYEEQLRIGPPAGAPSDPPGPSHPRWLRRTARTAYAGALWSVLRKIELRPEATTLERSVRSAAIQHYLRTLGELKGLRMKLGQMFANLDALDPSLTPETRAALGTGALRATPMSKTEVAEVFLRELGRTPRQLFANWSAEPLFAASIGQVHEATLKTGRRVAVKVQYPNMAEVLESDFRNIDLLDRLFCVINPSQRPNTFFDELRARFLEECDYTKEAENVRRFRELFRERSDIQIPEVFPAFSTQRVLTCELASGLALHEFASRASQAERDRAGLAIWEFFYVPALTEGIFHADPHAANLLFRERSVVFLDFGRVGRTSGRFLELWQLLIRAVLEKDRARATSLLAQMEFTPRTPSPDNADFYRLTLVNHLPWLCEGRFAFTYEYARTTWRLFSADSNRAILSVPRDSVLWGPLFLGLLGLLVELRCGVDWRERMLRLVYRPEEARPPAYTPAELARLGIPGNLLTG
jgi:transcriptional regulator with XRE-family HTH domain